MTAPTTPSAKREPSELVKRLRAYSYADADAVEQLERELAEAKNDVNTLNETLRQAGWGQGEIDHTAAMVQEEIEARAARSSTRCSKWLGSSWRCSLEQGHDGDHCFNGRRQHWEERYLTDDSVFRGPATPPTTGTQGEHERLAAWLENDIKTGFVILKEPKNVEIIASALRSTPSTQRTPDVEAVYQFLEPNSGLHRNDVAAVLDAFKRLSK